MTYYRVLLNDEACFPLTAADAVATYDEAAATLERGDVLSLDVWNGPELGYVATLERRA